LNITLVARKLARVLDNLVVDAIKFSPQKATIELCAESEPGKGSVFFISLPIA